MRVYLQIKVKVTWYALFIYKHENDTHSTSSDATAHTDISLLSLPKPSYKQSRRGGGGRRKKPWCGCLSSCPVLGFQGGGSQTPRVRVPICTHICTQKVYWFGGPCCGLQRGGRRKRTLSAEFLSLRIGSIRHRTPWTDELFMAKNVCVNSRSPWVSGWKFLHAANESAFNKPSVCVQFQRLVWTWELSAWIQGIDKWDLQFYHRNPEREEHIFPPSQVIMDTQSPLKMAWLVRNQGWKNSLLLSLKKAMIIDSLETFMGRNVNQHQINCLFGQGTLVTANSKILTPQTYFRFKEKMLGCSGHPWKVLYSC